MTVYGNDLEVWWQSLNGDQWLQKCSILSCFAFSMSTEWSDIIAIKILLVLHLPQSTACTKMQAVVMIQAFNTHLQYELPWIRLFKFSPLFLYFSMLSKTNSFNITTIGLNLTETRIKKVYWKNFSYPMLICTHL